MDRPLSSSDNREFKLRQINLPKEYRGCVILDSGLRVVNYCSDELDDERKLIFDPVDKHELEALREKAHSANEPCIVCMEKDAPIQKLSACGHILCDVCLCSAVTTEGKYPVICPRETCQAEIALKDLDVAFSSRNEDASELCRVSERLLLTAFVDYLHSAKSNVALCKNKGCNAVIELEPFVTHSQRNGVQEAVPSLSSCTSCNHEYCLRCGDEPHEAPDCMEAHVLRNFAKDKDFREWHLKDPKTRRLCPVPKCMFSVEKDIGCNHTLCVSCKTHFCWTCTAFTAEYESVVYSHLRAVHGGVGAVIVDDVEQQQRRQLAEGHMLAARVTDDLEVAWEHFRLAGELDQESFASEAYAPMLVEEEEEDV